MLATAAPLAVDDPAATVFARGVEARLVVDPPLDDVADPLVVVPPLVDPPPVDPPLVEGAVTAAGTVPS